MSKVKINLSKNFIDKNLKIEGTKFDRSNKLSKSDISKMCHLREKGMSLYKLAKKFNVAVSTVQYHTIEGFKEKANKQRLQYGFTSVTDYNERIKYKKSLIESGEVNFCIK